MIIELHTTEAGFLANLIAAYRDQQKRATGKTPTEKAARKAIRTMQAMGFIPFRPVTNWHVLMERRPMLEFVSTQPGNQSGIYAIVHAESGKTYIGSSGDIRRRWAEHRRALGQGRALCKPFQNAWNKYGEAAFDWGVIEFCDGSLLLSREQHYIDLHQTTDMAHGYNICPVAGSLLGTKQSDESKAKMKAAWSDPGMRQRQSASMKVANNRPGARARMSARMKEVKNAPGMNASQSATQKEVQNRPDVRSKKSASLKAAHQREDVIARHSAAATKSQSRPELKARQSVIQKEVQNRPEVQAKKMASIKEVWRRRKESAVTTKPLPREPKR